MIYNDLYFSKYLDTILLLYHVVSVVSLFSQWVDSDPHGQVISDALKAGYRCFDCAQFYENEVRHRWKPLETVGNRWKPVESWVHWVLDRSWQVWISETWPVWVSSFRLFKRFPEHEKTTNGAAAGGDRGSLQGALRDGRHNDGPDRGPLSWLTNFGKLLVCRGYNMYNMIQWSFMI